MLAARAPAAQERESYVDQGVLNSRIRLPDLPDLPVLYGAANDQTGPVLVLLAAVRDTTFQ
jgi:hypothetical protein